MVVVVVAGVGSAFVVVFVVLAAVEVVVDLALVAVLIVAAAAVLVGWLLVWDFVPRSRFLSLGSLGHRLCHR